MKKYIRSSKSIMAARRWYDSSFDSLIEDADRYGYILKVSDSDKPKMMITAKDRNYPRIDVETIDIGSGQCEFSVKVSFNDIKDEDSDNYDSVEYILEQWAENTGKLVTLIRSFVYDSSIEYEEIE